MSGTGGDPPKPRPAGQAAGKDSLASARAGGREQTDRLQRETSAQLNGNEATRPQAQGKSTPAQVTPNVWWQRWEQQAATARSVPPAHSPAPDGTRITIQARAPAKPAATVEPAAAMKAEAISEHKQLPGGVQVASATLGSAVEVELPPVTSEDRVRPLTAIDDLERRGAAAVARRSANNIGRYDDLKKYGRARGADTEKEPL